MYVTEGNHFLWRALSLYVIDLSVYMIRMHSSDLILPVLKVCQSSGQVL